MILSVIAAKLKRRSKDDCKGRHFEAPLILEAVCWYLRYALSYRDIEELFRERGPAVDHSTLNRWVLAYAPLIERWLRAFRRPHCGSIRINETYIVLLANQSVISSAGKSVNGISFK
jgi:transposase, IS6 family